MKAHVALMLVLPVVAMAHISSGTLDVHELHSVQYSIQMLDTPVSEEQDGGLTTLLVNKEGQRYRCSLPPLEETRKDQDKSDEEQVTDVSSLLAPVGEGPCIYKTKDWWTYEICYNRDIKQYHVENDKPVGTILVLGVHSPDLDNWEASNRTYQSHWYSNGTRCDLTGRPRQTELRFVCNEAATVEFVGDIFEPQSCEYTIVVHTARLCGVPWLKAVADPTPLPIQCNPLLTGTQYDRYQLYQEKMTLAAKLAEEKKKAEKEQQASLLANSKGTEAGALDGILSMVGDNMADKLLSEINVLLDAALTDNTDGVPVVKDSVIQGLKVVDLRGKDKKEALKEIEKNSEAAEEVTADQDIIESSKPIDSSDKIISTAAKWNLINSVHKPMIDEEYHNLVSYRNNLWRKIHESKKLVKKYTSQLHDTDTFLEKEAVDTFQNPSIVEKLEHQKKTLEKALLQAMEQVRLYESTAKDVSNMIMARQGQLAGLEEKLWRSRLDVLVQKMKEGDTDFHEQLKDMADDYKKVTNERLVKIDDYFRVARKIVKTDEIEGFEKLTHFLKFADGELMGIIEEESEMLVFDKEVDALSDPDKIKVSKFKDLVKDDVREQFSEILKEVSEDLELPDGDVDKDEAMKAMGETLDQLIGKLAGTDDKINKVHKHVSDLKKLTADQEETDKMVSLKRDGKKSVKKELHVDENGYARGDIPGIHIRSDVPVRKDEDGELDETEEDEIDSEIRETKNKLAEAEKEVEQLETEVKELRQARKPLIPNKSPQIENKDLELDNVKVSVTKLSSGGVEGLDEEQTDKFVKKLEGTIKDKLSQLGLDTGNRPIEVKLITTNIPEGFVEGGEGGDQQNDRQMQGMFFNMMTGNIQGYEDINSQRKAESSYKFSWDDSLVEEMEQKIEGFGDERENEPEEVHLVEEHDDVDEIIVVEKEGNIYIEERIVDLTDDNDDETTSGRVEESDDKGKDEL